MHRELDKSLMAQIEDLHNPLSTSKSLPSTVFEDYQITACLDILRLLNIKLEIPAKYISITALEEGIISIKLLIENCSTKIHINRKSKSNDFIKFYRFDSLLSVLDRFTLPYKIKLTIGDWSGDGHGMSEDYYFISNAPVEVIRQRHQNGIADNVESTSFKALVDGEIDVYTCLREWVEAIQKGTDIKLKLISDESFSSINFFGMDSKGEAFKSLGYDYLSGY